MGAEQFLMSYRPSIKSSDQSEIEGAKVFSYSKTRRLMNCEEIHSSVLELDVVCARAGPCNGMETFKSAVLAKAQCLERLPCNIWWEICESRLRSRASK